MKTVLVGNGINIQFGGAAYTSQFIIERMRCRALTQKYDVLFENGISGEELSELFDGFVYLTNLILKGKYDNLNMSNDLREALNDFKKRYNKVSYPHDIMLEDWFLVLKIYFLRYNNGEDDISAEIAFRRLFLDAIYNDGKIQTVYQNMSKKVKRFFKGFDEIYTTNYDTNLEQLTSKQVFHLHGKFTELQMSENPEYMIGYRNCRRGKLVVTPSFEHCFCNALLSYSGELKYKEAMMMHQANVEVANIPIHSLFNILEKEVRELLLIHKLHPELKIAPEYYFDRFENITGELCVIGMSPNNDQHIINIIKSNPNITKVKFYCYSSSEQEIIRNMGDARFEPMDSKKLWGKLGVERQKGYTYRLPPDSDNYLVSLVKSATYLTMIQAEKK